jgi:hypothetical protein
VDLDQSGNPEQVVRVNLGPTLGWVNVRVNPAQSINISGIYNVAPGTGVVMVDSIGPVTVNLPDVTKWVQESAYMPATGFERAILIKDLGGNAATANITVKSAAGQFIDKTIASFIMATANEVLCLLPLRDMSGWYNVSSGTGTATGGGGATTIGGVPLFATPTDAQQAFIATGTKFVTVQGNKTPGDGGAATYGRVNSLPSPYVGDGTPSTIPILPPSLTSGGLPINVFSLTWANQNFGPTSQVIVGGSLAFVVVFDGPTPPAASFTDSAGNTYLQVGAFATAAFGTTTIYYCANPVTAPVGTTFNLPNVSPACMNVYSVPGFTGAVLDQVVIQNLPSNPGGVSLSTGVLSAAPELVIGAVAVQRNPRTDPSITLAYSLPAGWFDIEPPIGGRNPIGCIAVSSTAPVTFAPTWNPIYSNATGAIVATFRTFPRASIDASFWQLMPTSPLHTRQYGIDPNTPDNLQAYQNFSNYLGTTAASSGGVTAARAGAPGGTVTISIASPAVITSTPALFPSHGLRNGQAISFSTTGQLPIGIVPGQIYYVQYGTVTPTTFQISTTSIFNAYSAGGQQIAVKGTPINTTGTQSGVHSYTTYGQSWTDFVVDPGTYYASQNQAPGIGSGLQKWRLFGYGAHFATNTYFYGDPEQDINSTQPGHQAYGTQFQSTVQKHVSEDFNDFIVLSTPAQATNFYVNSWVALMCIEMLGGSGGGNWNPAIFEYAKIKSINYGTGTITFWDKLQYNYRSTYPPFPSSNFTCGPATIVQWSDVFDQEIEVHGLNIYGQTEQTCGGVLSLRYVDCDIWGVGFDTGPSPVEVRRFTMENCRFHNFNPEVDKMIDYMLYADCDFDTGSVLRFQSASINKTVIDRCKMMAGIVGTPKDITIRDSFIAGGFTYGPVYGSTQRMTLINTHVQRMINANEGSQGLSLSLPGLTFVNGTIKIASGTAIPGGGTWTFNSASVCPAPWAQPGAKVVIEPSSLSTSGFANPATGCSMVACFTVLDLYVDGGGAFCIDTDIAAFPNTAITVTGTVSGTTLTATAISPAGAALLRGAVLTGGTLPANTTVVGDHGGMPGVNTGTFTLSNSATIGTSTNFTATFAMNFLPHPCPRLTVVNCTGAQFVADMAGAPPDIPMFSYFKRAYAGLALNVNTQEKCVILAGKLLTWTINVLKPYTGAGANYVCQLSITGFAISGGITYPTYIAQTIDLKTPGLRTITATGFSGNVGTDSISAIPFWLSGAHNVQIGVSPGFGSAAGDTMANTPFFVMTAQTDQGVDFATMTVNATSGVDQFADTTTLAANT